MINNYVDVNNLNILCKKNQGMDVSIMTAGKGSLKTKDINKFNARYSSLSAKAAIDFLNRFLIIDDKEDYFIGSSIKDAGKKSFALTKIEDGKMVQDLINKARWEMVNLSKIKWRKILERNILIFMEDIDKDRRIDEEALI